MIIAKIVGKAAAILSLWLALPCLAKNVTDDRVRVERPKSGDAELSRSVDDTWREMDEITQKLCRIGRFDLAVENAKSALAVAERSFPADDLRVGDQPVEPPAFSKQSATDAAGPPSHWARHGSVSILEKATPRPTEDLVKAYCVHSSCLCNLKKYEEAEAVLRKALAVMEQIHGPLDGSHPRRVPQPSVRRNLQGAGEAEGGGAHVAPRDRPGRKG